MHQGESLDAVDVHPVNPVLEEALRVLAGSGLPTQPAELQLEDVSWGDIPMAGVRAAKVGDDGTLQVEEDPPPEVVLIPDPGMWHSQHFVAEVQGHGPLAIEEGASTVAHLVGWRWSALSNPTRSDMRLWAAPLKFMTSRAPLALERPHGNMLLAVGTDLVRGWRFQAGALEVFFVPSGDTWYLAVPAANRGMPDVGLIQLVRSVFGFVLGETIGVGVFRPVASQGPLPGMVHLGLHHQFQPRAASQPPALPFNCPTAWTVALVDGILKLAHDEPGAPVLRVVNLYFASLSGLIESKFLHAWLALETLAHWGLKRGRIPDGGRLRLADHEAWLTWVAEQKEAIERLALPGMEQSLVGRVQSAEFGSPTRVQRAFRGLQIGWTAEMNDAEEVRHGVAHEGAMSDSTRDWNQDRARVGLVKTMVVALFAKLGGYSGPIADRSKTCFQITDQAVPSWWNSSSPPRGVDHRGSDTQEIVARAQATLARLKSEEGSD